jgi:zinc resistance-associated protein
MWKAVLAGTTVLAIAGASLAYAQQPPGGPGPHHQRSSVDNVAAFADARIAALKAGLRLTTEQEKLWPTLESAIRDLVESRIDRMNARRDAPRTRNPIERLRARADLLSRRGAELKRLAEAAGPLYDSLDEAQKYRFRVLARPMRLRHLASARWRYRDHRWRERGRRGWYHQGGWYDRDDMRGPGRGPGHGL